MADKLDLHGFDMVLALTENAINAQLLTLFKEAHHAPEKGIMPAEVDWKIPHARGTIKATLGPTRVSFMPHKNTYQNVAFILPLIAGGVSKGWGSTFVWRL